MQCAGNRSTASPQYNIGGVKLEHHRKGDKRVAEITATRLLQLRDRVIIPDPAATPMTSCRDRHCSGSLPKPGSLGPRGLHLMGSTQHMARQRGNIVSSPISSDGECSRLFAWMPVCFSRGDLSDGRTAVSSVAGRQRDCQTWMEPGQNH